MKVISFTKNNIGLFYLSPYVEFIANKEKTVFRNDLFNKITITPPIKGNADLVIEKLKNGVEPELALQFIEQNFYGDNHQTVLDGLLQNGIIE